MRGGADNDEALLMMQACTVAFARQLQVLTRHSAESGTPEATPLSRPVAESEGASTPPTEHTRIHWVAQLNLPTLEESESHRLTKLEATPAQ